MFCNFQRYTFPKCLIAFNIVIQLYHSDDQIYVRYIYFTYIWSWSTIPGSQLSKIFGTSWAIRIMQTSFAILFDPLSSISEITFVVQSLSHIRACVTPWTRALYAFLSFSIFWSLPKLMSIESEMPSNHLILCQPLLLLPSSFSSIKLFPDELTLRIRWPKPEEVFIGTSDM